MIRRLSGLCKLVWYADDSAATGTVQQLRALWERLTKYDPDFGYYPNASKTWIVVKPEHHNEATKAHAESGINITSEGRPYLGAAIGSESYITEYVSNKVKKWSSNLTTLISNIAKSQPHAAFAALTNGLLNKWTHLSRVQPHFCHLLTPLDDVLKTELIPAITGSPPPNDMECSLFELPAKLGGLDIRFPSHHADREHRCTQSITRPLTDQILHQNHEYNYDILNEQYRTKPESAGTKKRKANLRQTPSIMSCQSSSSWQWV